MTLATWSQSAGLAVLEPLRDEPGPVLIALQALQEAFGFIPTEAIALVATFFNVSRAEVHGVLTYYEDLRAIPPLANEIHICVAEACQAVGSRNLEQAVKRAYGEQVRDVFCFGNCALGPAAMVNGVLIGRATPAKIAAAIK